MSTALTSTQQQRLGLVRPELRQLLAQLLDAAALALGFRCEIPEDGGTRTAERQAALYADSLAEGGGTLAYPVAPAGRSRHQYGAAFDLDIVAGGSAADGTGTTDDYRQLADLARSLGLTAGYYFSHSDRYHYQLTETLEDSIARWPALQTSHYVKWVAIAAGGALLLRSLS